MTVTAHDIDVLAKTAWGEARGEGPSGMLAVCWVAINRARIAAETGRRQFGDGSIAGACLATTHTESGRTVWQFDCWADGDPNQAKVNAVTLDDISFQRAVLAALSVILGRVSDPTQGATGYWAMSIPTPSWAEGKQYVSIGRHRFVRDV